jgi:ABC-type dipeptide/oligopeptide/nickel transport system permease subunit
MLVNTMRWCAHSLLAHLTLVHNTGSLVVVTERGQSSNQTQHVGGVDLNMGRRMFSILLFGSNISFSASNLYFTVVVVVIIYYSKLVVEK